LHYREKLLAGGSFRFVVKGATHGIGLGILGAIGAFALLVGLSKRHVKINTVFNHVREKTQPAPKADSDAPE
jgi:hypothetical protein